jgi:hypothetical protein
MARQLSMFWIAVVAFMLLLAFAMQPGRLRLSSKGWVYVFGQRRTLKTST